MPELPEAETIVHGLRTAVLGEVIRRVDVLHHDILRQPKAEFVRGVKGRRIEGVGRRGKNVLIRLDGDRVIAVNLGMTGRLLPFPTLPKGDGRPGHPAVRFRFESGALLIFDDTRRFGTLEAFTEDEWQGRSARMGPEPLDSEYRARDLFDALQRSRAPARSWLLDQKKIAGVGNIYANEALYLAGVHPQREARQVCRRESVALYRSLRRVLRDAIRAGGTTIRDYRNAEGGRGEYAQRLHVYGRDGEPCLKCQSHIRRIVFANRSAFYCPTCQPVAT
jgi:formamidopyrimidine-DNA glycosylase